MITDETCIICIEKIVYDFIEDHTELHTCQYKDIKDRDEKIKDRKSLKFKVYYIPGIDMTLDEEDIYEELAEILDGYKTN